MLYASLERRRSPTASLRRSGNHDQGKKFQNPPKIRAAKIVAQKHNDQISASNLCFTFVNLVFQLGLTFTSVDRFCFSKGLDDVMVFRVGAVFFKSVFSPCYKT